MFHRCLATAMAFLWAQGSPSKGEMLTKMQLEINAAEKSLVRALENDDIWFDRKKQPLLEEYLKGASLLRAPALGVILSENISYEVRSGKLVPLEVEYPAYGALRRIGFDAVKPILAQLKGFDPEDLEIKTVEDERTKADEIIKLKHRAFRQGKQRLLVLCLIDIYNQGGFGKVLALKRIELEAQKATGKEKERLLKALKDPSLK